MNAFGALDGFVQALTPAHLGWGALGDTLGTAVGVLPGIGPALTVALLLPTTYGLEPTSVFITFAGIYYGGILVVASVGAWDVHRATGDIPALAAVGLLGFGLRAPVARWRQ